MFSDYIGIKLNRKKFTEIVDTYLKAISKLEEMGYTREGDTVHICKEEVVLYTVPLIWVEKEKNKI